MTTSSASETSARGPGEIRHVVVGGALPQVARQLGADPQEIIRFEGLASEGERLLEVVVDGAPTIFWAWCKEEQ